MKILVSHPGKQHAHQLIQGLSEKFNVVFVTSYWFQPASLLYSLMQKLLFPGKSFLLRQLYKRYHKPIENIRIIEKPIPEFIRLLCLAVIKPRDFEKFVFIRDRNFDHNAALVVLKQKPGVVVGYEMACLETFKAAKKNGAITVLDLAQIHYNEIEAIASRFPTFGRLFREERLRKKINEIKEAELCLADYILCLSDFAEESLIKNGVLRNKIFKVNLGFNPETFKAKDIYSENGKFRFVFAGTLTKRKGIDLLIQAFEDLNLYDSELLLIGPITDARELIPKNNTRIKHIDYVSHKELNLLLNQSDVFVFPSYLDSWAMVVVEAMACGLPVVVSINTGASDVVRQGGGYVIHPEIITLRGVMKYFYDNRKEVERLGREARKIAEQYTWEKYHKQVREAFQKMV